MLLLFFNILLQLLALPGMTILTGLFVMAGKRIFYKIMGRRARFIEYVTGIIGTPIHELSHALMCILFGHKIKEMRLFQLDPKSNTLGHVTHSYNRKNIYQAIGNFFIGIAPLVCGAIVISLLIYLLQPVMYNNIFSLINISNNSFSGLMTTVSNIFEIFFLKAMLADFKWWILLVLSSFIVLHMELSKEDIAGSLKGFLFYLIILIIVNFILYSVGNTANFVNITKWLIIINTVFLTIVVAYLAVLILFAFIVKAVSVCLRKIMLKLHLGKT